MIWPFNKKPVMTQEEWAEKQPPAPCADQQQHYFWKLNGISCPICAGQKEADKKIAEENRLAEKIAAKVAEKLSLPTVKEET